MTFSGQMAGPQRCGRPVRLCTSRTDRRTPRLSTGGASTLRRDAGRRRSRQTCLSGGPSTISPATTTGHPPSRMAGFVRLPAGRAALVAEEPLDVRDQVVARRQALLVVHRLEPLDIAAGRVVEPAAVSSRARSSRASSASSRAGISAPRWRPERAQQLDAPPWHTARRRSGGPGRSSRGPGCRRPPPRSRAPRRAPTGRAGSFGPGHDVAAQQAGRRLGADDRDRPGVGDGRRDRPEADPLGHAEPPGELDDVRGEAPPAVVGLGTDEDEQVALVEPRAAAGRARARSASSAGRRRSRAVGRRAR